MDEFFKSAFSINCSIFGYDGVNLKILLVERAIEPFVGKWSLPSHLISPEENTEASIDKMLQDLLGKDKVFKKQLRSFFDPERHPLGRVITIPFFSLINLLDLENQSVKNINFAKSMNWFELNRIPNLPFDHNSIINTARKTIQSELPYESSITELLSEKFTMGELHHLHELILEENLDKRNFSKKIFKLNFLEELEEIRYEKAGRPAKMFKTKK